MINRIIMMLWQLLKLLARLFCLRAKPYDLPYSKALLWILGLTMCAVKIVALLWFIDVVRNYDTQVVIRLGWGYAALVTLVYVLVLVACVRTTLSSYKVPERAVQVITALFSVDLWLSAIFLAWVWGLSLVSLPLQPNSMGALGLILVFILLMYWQFMVYIHIFYSSLTITVLRAGIFAFVYIFMQHNITDLLMSLVITEVGK